MIRFLLLYKYRWSLTEVSSPFHDDKHIISFCRASCLSYASSLGPLSRSTNAVRVSALNHYEAFLLTKQLPKSNELNEKDVTNAAIFQEFGSYLIDAARLSGGDLSN